MFPFFASREVAGCRAMHRLISARCALCKPSKIRAIVDGNPCCFSSVPSGKNRSRCKRIPPFMNFCMTVGERHSASASMVAGRQFCEGTGSICAGGIGIENPVVYCVRMFINKNPTVTRSRHIQPTCLRGMVETGPAKAVCRFVTALSSTWRSAHGGVHGNAAHPVWVAQLFLWGT